MPATIKTMPPLPDPSPVNGKRLTTRFDGGSLSSDAGLPALREVERRLYVGGKLAACLDDPRDPARTLHSAADILRFRMLMIAAGHEDGTVSCAGGQEGVVSDGAADFEGAEMDLSAAPATRTQVMRNMADPGAAFRWWRLPADGVGLARMEFVISNAILAEDFARRFEGFSIGSDDLTQLTLGVDRDSGRFAGRFDGAALPCHG